MNVGQPFYTLNSNTPKISDQTKHFGRPLNMFDWVSPIGPQTTYIHLLTECSTHPHSSHTKTPPAFCVSPASYVYYWVALDLAAFIMWSYAPSKFLISVLTAVSVYVICFMTAFKLFMTTLISGTTSTLVFSIRTPFTSLQHFLVSSSWLIDSSTSSFSLRSSSTSINF